MKTILQQCIWSYLICFETTELWAIFEQHHPNKKERRKTTITRFVSNMGPVPDPK